jgi:hypothetical protein
VTSTARTRGRGRGVAPAVGKALEAGIVVLFVALLTTTLYGGVVPDARTAAGDEVGERTLQHAAVAIQAAVPATPITTHVAVNGTVAERRVSLPDTIRSETYRITANGTDLVLVHDNRRVGGRTPLVLPQRVRDVRGNWTDGDVVVRVTRHPDGGVVVELAEGSP